MGGVEAVPHEFPWHVLVETIDTTETRVRFCGGSLISEVLVLTAASCTYGSNFTKGIVIVLGAHDLSRENEPGREIKYGETLIIHPDYDEKSLENNIALIKLNNPVMFNEYISPICLPQVETLTKPGDTVVTAGWGEELSSLMKVDLTVISNEDCKSQYTNVTVDGVNIGSTIFETAMCTQTGIQRRAFAISIKADPSYRLIRTELILKLDSHRSHRGQAAEAVFQADSSALHLIWTGYQRWVDIVAPLHHRRLVSPPL